MKLLKTLAHLNTATFSAIQMMLFTLMPFLAEKSQLSLTSIVFSFSAGSFLFLWSSPYWSAQSDRRGRLPILVVGVSGLAVSTAILFAVLFWPTYSSIFIWSSRLLYGLTASAIIPVTQALQMDLQPGKPPLRAMLSNSMSLNVGRALGPLYILLGSRFDMTHVLAGVAVWAFILLGINIAFVKTTLAQVTKASAHPLSWLGTLSKMRTVFSLALLFTIFIGILNFSLAAVLKKTFALSAVDASLLMAQLLLASSILAVTTQALGKIFFKNPWQGALALGAFGLGAGVLLLGEMSTGLEMWSAILLLSIGIALIPPSYLALMATKNSNESQLGQRTGMVGAANTLGYTIGGAIAAFTFKISLFDIESVLITVAALILINIVILHRTRQQEVAYV